MQEIDISIVTYNSKKWLPDFFHSLMQINYPLAFLNIFVHDNASSDGTIDWLMENKEKLNSTFKHFEISCSDNKGFGYGHNRNFSLGSAPFFLVTNVDLTFESDALNQVLLEAKKDAEEIFASFEFRQKPYEHPKMYDAVTQETEWSSSACILFRRTAFEKIQGYEEKIFLYGEDVEISFRLRDCGYKLKYCPKAVCWHYSYAYPNEHKPQLSYGGAISNIYIRLRYGNPFEMLMGYLFYFYLFYLAKNNFETLKKIAKDFIIVLKNTPYFLRTRKKSDLKFTFRKGNYAVHRVGAFYACEALPDQKSLPLISVIIRTIAGRKESLIQAITSVFNQTYPSIELIVVEDGSESAREIIDIFSKKAGLTSVVFHAIEKGGRCLAGNAGLALAKGELVIFLDDDDLFFADHLEVLAQKIIQYPSANAAYSIASQIPTQKMSDNPLVYKTKEAKVFYKKDFSKPALWVGNYLPIQSVLFRRECFLKQGGFDPNLAVLEDWDLWIRYSLEGDFVFVEKETSAYRIPLSKKEFFYRDRLFFETYPQIIKKFENYYTGEMSVGDILKASDVIASIKYSACIERRKIKKMLLTHFFIYKAYDILNESRFLKYCKLPFRAVYRFMFKRQKKQNKK